MIRTYKAQEDETWNGLYPRILYLINQNKWSLEFFGAVLGLGLGIFLVIAGTEFDILAWLLAPNNAVPILKKMSLVSYLLVLPCGIIGAHFLDLLERKTEEF
jgi:hypothetical protein